MELLQLREKEIFEILRRIKKFNFIVIGDYAVNCYTLPRFSVDCDVVLMDNKEAEKIAKELEKFDYIKTNPNEIETPYHIKFIRYERKIEHNFKGSIDLFVKEVIDRRTNAIFTAKWIFENSNLRFLKGKTIIEQLKLRIINPDALFVMKFITSRTAYIRDVFMLISKVKDINWVKKEISIRYNFDEIFNKIKNSVISLQFKNNLQGVYGYIDENLFKKYKEALLKIGQ